MTEEIRLAPALALLRQHLKEVQAVHQLSPADCVRLASALLSTALADGRNAGVSEGTLQALDRDGESLAIEPDIASGFKSKAAADLMAEIAREPVAEAQSPSPVAEPLLSRHLKSHLALRRLLIALQQVNQLMNEPPLGSKEEDRRDRG